MNVALKIKIFEMFGTQGDFARSIGMSEHRLSRIINNREAPTIKEIKKITKKLNVEAEDLFEICEIV